MNEKSILLLQIYYNTNKKNTDKISTFKTIKGKPIIDYCWSINSKDGKTNKHELIIFLTSQHKIL